jgi:hypothetical protein
MPQTWDRERSRRANVVILCCAISAGIHAALVPEHFDEGTGAGLGFVLSTVLLLAVAVILTRRPNPLAFAAGAALFAGLLVAYAFAVTTGVPVLHPETEALDGLALLTKAVEALGLAGALTALLFQPQPKGIRP